MFKKYLKYIKKHKVSYTIAVIIFLGFTYGVSWVTVSECVSCSPSQNLTEFWLVFLVGFLILFIIYNIIILIISLKSRKK